MLTFVLDPHLNTPLYQQLYHFVRREIETGRLATGERLPSKRKLSAHLNISQNTVITAYEQLVAEGYIYAEPKRGYFVSAFEAKLNQGPSQKSPGPAPQKHHVEPAYTYDFKTNTVDALDFPFPLWAKISREVLHNDDGKLLTAVEPQGYLPLRQEIADYVHRYRGVVCSPDQIVVGAGTEYLIGLIVQLLGRDKRFAVENPNYNRVYKVIQMSGAEVELSTLDDSGVIPESLETLGVDVLHLTPSHQFPLGIVMPVGRRMALLKWAEAAPGRCLIEDDYDSEYRFSGRPIPALQGLDTAGRVIYLNTFTRSLAPSMRISYMILPPALMERYKKSFGFYSSTVPRFEQHTLYKFMAAGHFERHLIRMRKLYKLRRSAILTALKSLPLAPRLSIVGTQAGLHLLVSLNGATEEAMVKAAQAANIRVYGLSEYCIRPAPALPKDVVILGYASFTPEEITQAIAKLGEAWRTL
ncbi:MAG: PLP-dependent aminotransferase family protein [Eubacterium sp.]|nr:PLP-dependent aminotransferase family protein [Eubacterium sp.]